MDIKAITGCCFVLFLLIIVDVDGAWRISKEEDMELEKQLKILNKPAVKTIRTDSGQIFDCVDIHEQPSLDHPLLKNHKVQSAKLAANDKPIYGVTSILNVYKPTLLSPDQVSGSMIYLSTGFGDDSKSVVSVGWAVMPPVYRDNFTHLFAYWTADNSKTTGCYDILCPGFVQQSHEFALDSKSGDWYLRVNGASVGYWPKELFRGAFEVAKEVNWGGEIFSPRQPCPPMGSGHFESEGIGGACYISDMRYQTAAGGFFEDIDPELQALVDSPHCYNVSMPSYLSEIPGYTFLFGGPGGQC
ncbi:hypothetical protein AAG906_027463 [Vitis piasezkii]